MVVHQDLGKLSPANEPPIPVSTVANSCALFLKVINIKVNEFFLGNANLLLVHSLVV